jgi:hypothetical protein
VTPAALSTCRVHQPGFASPGTFHPQGFSPSRWFAPRQTARPCFMPERSWSLAPSEPSPRPEPCHLSVACALLPLILLGRAGVFRPPEPSASCHAALLSGSRFADEPVHGVDRGSLEPDSASGPCSPERVRCHRGAGWAPMTPGALLGFMTSPGPSPSLPCAGTSTGGSGAPCLAPDGGAAEAVMPSGRRSPRIDWRLAESAFRRRPPRASGRSRVLRRKTSGGLAHACREAVRGAAARGPPPERGPLDQGCHG